MLQLHPTDMPQAWERAKVGLRRVDDDCRIDLSELSSEPLEVEMENMDDVRRLKNRGGQVRVQMVGLFEGCFAASWHCSELPPVRGHRSMLF